VVALDPSAGMLREALQRPLHYVIQGVGERLPFAAGTFDLLIIGYALRHVADLGITFQECQRVLKPGGCLLLLEITAPRLKLPFYLLKAYLRYIVPTVTRLGRHSPEAQQLMAYYWDTIEHCVTPERIVAALQQAGFKRVKRSVQLGIFSEYTAIL
jgi:demethylmenaquinone methyltransferase/2-methoxy-6-polyprenyl-1,4-benzoquinol methylase